MEAYIIYIIKNHHCYNVDVNKNNNYDRREPLEPFKILMGPYVKALQGLKGPENFNNLDPLNFCARATTGSEEGIIYLFCTEMIGFFMYYR